MDYVGIVVLQFGSCGPPYYYGFKCNPLLQAFYLAFVYVLAAIFIYMLIFTKFSRKGRSYAFLIYGLVVAIPAFHYIYLYGLQDAVEILHLDLLATMGFFYIAGMLIYTYKIPERFIPSYCNLWVVYIFDYFSFV